jgi:hypothetical protein
MLQKVKAFALRALPVAALATVASTASAQYVSTPIDEEGAVTIITDMVGTFSGTLGGVLPVILGIVAVLMGLFFGVRQARKRLGGAK